MPQFHETRMGQKFYQGTMPRIADAMENIAALLKYLQEEVKREQEEMEQVARDIEKHGGLDDDDASPEMSRPIGEGMVFIDPSGLASGIPLKSSEDEESQEEEESAEDPFHFGESYPSRGDLANDILEAGGDFSSTSANSLYTAVMFDDISRLTPASIADFDLGTPVSVDKFAAIQFFVRRCEATVEELFRVACVLPDMSPRDLQSLVLGPTDSPWYGRDLWECDGPKKPK